MIDHAEVGETLLIEHPNGTGSLGVVLTDHSSKSATLVLDDNTNVTIKYSNLSRVTDAEGG